MNDVKEQLTAINQRKLSMRDALRQVWSGQEAKNPFDNGQKVKKERKDFAKKERKPQLVNLLLKWRLIQR